MRWTRQCRVRMRSQGEEIRERPSKARETSGSVADGEVVWSWHPLLMLSRVETPSAQPVFDVSFNPRGDGGKRNSSPGRARISRKTIAWGMPDVPGASAVNTRVHTYYPQRTRGCGCIGHPAFPAPSVFKGREFQSIARALGVARHENMSAIAWSCAAVSIVIVRLDRTLQYSRDDSDVMDEPRRTGYPAGACHRARRRRDPVAGYDGG